MKSIRLNSEIRQAILDNISKAYDIANNKPEKTINSLKILEEAVLEHYTKQSKQLRELVETHKELETAVEFSTSITFVTPTGSWEHIDIEPDKKFFNKYAKTRDFRNTEYVNSNPILKKALNKYTELRDKEREEDKLIHNWNKEKEKYLDDIFQVLKGVNTTKQLIEQWPEVQEYIPLCYFNPSKINLPSIDIKSLNQKIGK